MSLLQPKQLREYLDKLQNTADAQSRQFVERGMHNEKIVLCVATYGADGCPMHTRNVKDFAKDYV